jgi:hypothetical protein
MEEKSIFESKTFWANTVAGIVSVVILINPEMLVALGYTGESQTRILTVIGGLTAVLNIFLRTITDSPVYIKPDKTLMIIGLVMLSGFGFADSIHTADSLIDYNLSKQIINKTDEVLNIIPDSPYKTVAALIHTAVGGAICLFCIKLFRKKKK